MNFGLRIAVCDDETGTCSGIENMILYFACSGRKVEIYTDREKGEFYGAMRDVLLLSGDGKRALSAGGLSASFHSPL